jgi:DNA-directed RNA polymerase specialized sigma24 family protein
MSESSSSESLQQLGNTLHQRLIDGDPTATSQIAETFLFPVIQRLLKEFFSLPDPNLVDTAAEDAFINYFERPSQYDPAKGSLDKYLYMSARGDLLNLRKRAIKILARNVELDASNAEYEVEIPDAFDLEGLAAVAEAFPGPRRPKASFAADGKRSRDRCLCRGAWYLYLPA